MIIQDFRDLCYLVMGNVRKVNNRDLKKIGTIDRLRRRVADDPDDTTMFAMGAKVRRGCLPACRRPWVFVFLL